MAGRAETTLRWHTPATEQGGGLYVWHFVKARLITAEATDLRGQQPRICRVYVQGRPPRKRRSEKRPIVPGFWILLRAAIVAIVQRSTW